MEISAEKSEDSRSMTWEFFFQEFKSKYITKMYKETKWK